MKSISSHLVLSSLLAWTSAHIEISDDNSAIDAGLKQWRLMIPSPSVTVPGNALGLENDVEISDIGSLKRTGQTISRYHLNDLTFTGYFGFTDLKISGFSMKDGGHYLTVGGIPLDNVTITSTSNSINIEYSAKVQKVGCSISWAKFIIDDMNDVKINGVEDLNEEFNDKALQILNINLNKKPFLELLNTHMTPCKETPLKKLFWGE